jgi:hypothetical protein
LLAFVIRTAGEKEGDREFTFVSKYKATKKI